MYSNLGNMIQKSAAQYTMTRNSLAFNRGWINYHLFIHVTHRGSLIALIAVESTSSLRRLCVNKEDIHAVLFVKMYWQAQCTTVYLSLKQLFDELRDREQTADCKLQ